MSPEGMLKNLAVLAFRMEMSIEPSQASSILAKAFRLAPASTTAMSIFVPISAAFFLAAATAASAC